MKKRDYFDLAPILYVAYMVVGIVLWCLVLLFLPACSSGPNEPDLGYYPTALVTARTVDSVFVLQLDDSTTLYPQNFKKSPYPREVRALVNYVEEGMADNRQQVHINWIDSIRTKDAVPTMGEQNDSVYGKDPVEIVRDWVTVAENGYLTLRVRTRWGGYGAKHYLNLLTGINPENPYELELRHDAQGDVCGDMGDALIAFNLNDLPRDTRQDVKIKLHWQSFGGEKSTEFDLRLRPQKARDYPRLEMNGYVE